MPPVNIDPQQQQDNGGEQRPQSQSNNDGGSTNSTGEEVFTHKVEHKGVVCDNCNATIFGFRYKCCQCRDFDLCENCERRGLHAGHVMLRIAFPEMANDAIRNYILKSSASRCPAPSLGFAGIVPPNSGNDFNKERKRHCKRERHSACHHAPSSPDDSDDAQFPWGPQCPVMMGKKEIKKWAKCMKKTAHMHKRAAQQACSSATAAAGVGATQTETGQPRREGENVSQASPAFDFSAAASQIQEFLNAVGVPIDVVELYDEWGNRGTPRDATSAGGTNSEQQTARANETGQNIQDGVGASNVSSEQSGQSSRLADDLQKLNLEADGGNARTVVEQDLNTFSSNTGESARAPNMEVEGESGWTLLEADKTNNASAGEQPIENFSSVSEPSLAATSSSPLGVNTLGTDNSNSSVAAAAIPVGRSEDIASSNATNATAGGTTNQTTRPIYPQLSPQFQQVMNGITNTVGQVVRNIPIVPWSPSTNGNVFAPSRPQSSPESGNNGNQPELNERMQMTLNQLLSMGFSNHDGWLARLVASKNGNLEEVLNSLFPVPAGSSISNA